jgi:hypothetical protein
MNPYTMTITELNDFGKSDIGTTKDLSECWQIGRVSPLLKVLSVEQFYKMMSECFQSI